MNCRNSPDSASLAAVICLMLSLQATVSAQEGTNEVVLLFGGDVLLADHYESDVGEDVTRAFASLDLLRDADVAMVNLESPVTTRGQKISKPFNFRMNPLFLPAFTGGGIDIVNLANNHIFDYDSTGLFDTIRYLDSVSIRHVGAGKTETEAHSPVVLSIRGIRFAFFGYYGGGEAPAATESRPGVAARDARIITRDVERARRDHQADVIVVNLHWGLEKEPIPEPDQVDFAHTIVEAGADLVIGHHPHVLQAIETYHGRIIAYSLGNFIFGGNSRHTYDTALLKVCVRDGAFTYSLIPIHVDQWGAAMLDDPRGEELIRSVASLPLHQTENRETAK